MFRRKTWQNSITDSGAEAGFTLLEVVIAMAIMLLAMSAILSLESSSIRATENAKEMNIVAMLARNEMIFWEYKVEGQQFEGFKLEDQGVFEAPFQDYRWTMKIKELKFPDLTALMGKTGQSKEGEGQLQEMALKLFSNFLTKAIRELVVTVHWDRGGKEKTFVVSTYWVDLNHEFSMSEQ
ncbi:MAG: type IV pilus modification PilV family protein [Bdellovibrionota bacterium]